MRHCLKKILGSKNTLKDEQTDGGKEKDCRKTFETRLTSPLISFIPFLPLVTPK
jgi:hypothetical protein